MLTARLIGPCHSVTQWWQTPGMSVGTGGKLRASRVGTRRMGERPGSLEATLRHRLCSQAQTNQHPPDRVFSTNSAGCHWAWRGGAVAAHGSRPPNANVDSPCGKHAHWPPGHPSIPGCQSWMAATPSPDKQTPGLPGPLTESGSGSARCQWLLHPHRRPWTRRCFQCGPFPTHPSQERTEGEST